MPEFSSDKEFAEDIARVLKVLGHPTRLQIVAVLSHVGEAHVTGLMGCLELPQAIVSQQLALLRAQGLVSATRKEGYAWYSLADPHLVCLVRCLENPPLDGAKPGS
jgi:DNA-binding transcriptional ArsR family regulator